jgi:peptide deformylase
MLQPILKMGDQRLLQVSQAITTSEFNSLELLNLIADLTDTMRHNSGVGISAVQIGVLKRIALIEYDAANSRYSNIGKCDLTVVINPEVTVIREEICDFNEGCLSIPNMRGMVTRAKKIAYTYYDIAGNIIRGESDGFFARVLLHELDHMDGILYPMRIKDLRTFGFVDKN